MVAEQEVLTGEESGDGWSLTWTAWLLPDPEGQWWWQVDAHRSGTARPPQHDDQPMFFQAIDNVMQVQLEDGGVVEYDRREVLYLDGGTLDFGAGMGTIWNGPCDSRDEAIAAVERFVDMGRH